jgi:hypothetical protein
VEATRCALNHTANTRPPPSGAPFNAVGIDLVICRNMLVERREAHDRRSGGEPTGSFTWGEGDKLARRRQPALHVDRESSASPFVQSAASGAARDAGVGAATPGPDR